MLREELSLTTSATDLQEDGAILILLHVHIHKHRFARDGFHNVLFPRPRLTASLDWSEGLLCTPLLNLC